ncbi:MAG: phage portal protein [Pseudomonadota bacterium]
MTFDPGIELDEDALALLGETAMVGGAYEATDRNNKSLALWNPTMRSADGDVLPDKRRLDARARDLLRNDAYARAGTALRSSSIVGSRYALTAKPMGRLLGPTFDETWEEEFQEEVEARFSLWGEGPDNWVDAARLNTFTEMVRLAVGVHAACGEVLSTAEWMRSAARPYQTAIQMIDVDRLSNPSNRVTQDNRLRGGIERDRFGAPFAYYIRLRHPADWQYPDKFQWKRVPIRKPWGRLQVIHIFEQYRPDQSRGVAEMTTALKQMRMTGKFQDIVLQNAIVQATYAAAIESELPSAEAFATIGGVEDISEKYANTAAAYLSKVSEYSSGAKNLQLDGVKIPHLFPGTKLNLMPLGKGGPLGQDFEKSLLRYVAASLGVSYEQLTQDYSNTNYSSAKAAMAETWKRMNVLKQQVADRFASIVYRLWLEEAINKRQIESLPAVARREGWFYEAQRLDAISNANWIGASKGQVEELKETQAAVLRLKHNLTTHEQEAARLGLDWRLLLKQRKREIDTQREYDILPETDTNMENAASGDVRDDQTEGEPSDASDGDTDA